MRGNSQNPRGDTLAKLASAMHISVAELTGEVKLQYGPAPGIAPFNPINAGPTIRDLPVFGAAEGGDGVMILDNEPIEFTDRPANLAGVRGAYAVYVVNESMSPAYEQGDKAHIHPARPVKPGKDALFISTDDDGTQHAMIKRLVKSTEKHWKVQQFNPPRIFDLLKSKWQKAQRVVGSERAD